GGAGCGVASQLGDARLPGASGRTSGGVPAVLSRLGKGKGDPAGMGSESGPLHGRHGDRAFESRATSRSGVAEFGRKRSQSHDLLARWSSWTLAVHSELGTNVRVDGRQMGR